MEEKENNSNSPLRREKSDLTGASVKWVGDKPSASKNPFRYRKRCFAFQLLSFSLDYRSKSIKNSSPNSAIHEILLYTHSLQTFCMFLRFSRTKKPYALSFKVQTTKQKEQPNFQYGKSIFGRIGSSRKAAQKKSNYEL